MVNWQWKSRKWSCDWSMKWDIKGFSFHFVCSNSSCFVFITFFFRLLCSENMFSCLPKTHSTLLSLCNDLRCFWFFTLICRSALWNFKRAFQFVVDLTKDYFFAVHQTATIQSTKKYIERILIDNFVFYTF